MLSNEFIIRVKLQGKMFEDFWISFRQPNLQIGDRTNFTMRMKQFPNHN